MNHSMRYFGCILSCLPFLCFSQTQPTYRDSLLKIIQSKPGTSSTVNAYNLLAAYYIRIKPDSAMPVAQQGLQLAEKLHDGTGRANALVNISKCYRIKAEYPKALELSLQALREFEALKSAKEAALTSVEIAQVYKDMIGQNRTDEYINKGVVYARSAYDLFGSIEDTSGLVFSLNMQGILFRDKAMTFGRSNYYDTAFVTYLKALDFIKRSNKGNEYSGKLFNNISQVYLEYKKDYNKGLEYLFKAVAFNKEKNNVSSLSFNYGNISNAYSKLKDHTNALKYARLTLEATKQQGLPVRIQNGYQQMFSAFKESGQMDSALRYYVLADKLDDSLTNLAKTQQVMNLQVKYETVKKESEIKELHQTAAEQTKRIAWLAIVLSTIIALAAGLLWLYGRVKKQKQQIALQSQRLEVVMKELHHRVKNNLQIVSSLLSLQAYKLSDAESISVLRESQQRVQAMSLIHQRLYKKETLTSVNMKEYITDLTESLLSSYGFNPDDFLLNINIEKEVLDVEKALPIGLIINEIVTNAFKYAYKNIERPSLTINLKESNDELTLVVRDNGDGIDVNEWKKKGKSFGKQLIGVLSKQLRAQQSIDVTQGTQFTLVIPNKAA